MSRKLFTLDNLVDAINEDLTWRKKELKLLHDKIKDIQTPEQTALIRISIPIIYAHWEGYTKNICQYYLEYISNKFEINSALKPQLYALNIKNQIKIENNIESITKFIDFLFKEANNRSKIPYKSIINTKSNLKFDVFEEILFILSIDINNFKKFEDIINSLVDNRNNIAHGKFLSIKYSNYSIYYDAIVTLMNLLKNTIENSALEEKYKAVN